MHTETKIIPSGYKQTEIGVIPADWDVKQLGDLFEITSSKRVFQSEWKTNGIPFYRARELAVLGETGKIDNDLFISSEMYKSFKNTYGVPQKGDILVTGVGTLGKVYVVAGDHEFYFKDGNIIWFKINNSVNSEFLNQLFLTRLITKQIEDASAGTTVGTYTISGAKKTLIPFPLREEQDAMAKAFHDVDLLISKQQNLLEKKKNIKQGAMQELLTGKRRLHGFSDKWETKKMGELGFFYKGRGISSKDLVQDGLPCIMYGDIYVKFDTRFANPDFRITEATSAKSALAKTGDLFFTASGETAEEIGKCVVYQGKENIYIGGDIIAMTPNQETDSLFLAYMQNSSDLLSQKANLGQGHTVVHIYTEHIKTLKLSLPPTKKEQAAIATILSDMDIEIEKLESQLAKYQNLKQGMMQTLLTGKIRLLTK